MFRKFRICQSSRFSALVRNALPSKQTHNGYKGEMKVISRSATTPVETVNEDGSENEVVRPFLEMPLSGHRHWIGNVFEILFLHGGWQYSLFKIQDKAKNESPVCRRQNALGNEVQICDPEVMQFVLSIEGKLPKRITIPAMNDFYERNNKEPGVFFLNGEKWRKLKLAMSKRMLRPPKINAHIPKINSIAADLVARIKRERNCADDQFVYEVDKIDMELFKWSFETVANFLFDRDFNSLSENPPKRTVEFINAVGNFLENLVPVSILPPAFHRFFKIKAFEKFDRNFLYLYETAEELIEEKLQEISRDMSSRDGQSDMGLIPYLLSGQISESEVVCSIVDTLFAGVDTTSNTMQWMLYCLAKNPDVQERIRNEISDVVHSNTDVTEEELQKLSLTKAAIKETLRLYPVLIGTGRTLDCDTVLSGYHVPAGTRIFFLHHAMGRREDLFPQADSFIPERWLRENNRPLLNAFASIPFGFGMRMCLGRRLAELELQILLIKILQNFRLELPPEHEVKQRLRGTNIPDKPVRVKFIDI